MFTLFFLSYHFPALNRLNQPASTHPPAQLLGTPTLRPGPGRAANAHTLNASKPPHFPTLPRLNPPASTHLRSSSALPRCAPARDALPIIATAGSAEPLLRRLPPPDALLATCTLPQAASTAPGDGPGVPPPKPPP